MKNLHVLHLIDTLSNGGAERMLVDLANQTIADGAQASVCITRSGTEIAGELDSNIELCILNRKKRFDSEAMSRFANFVKTRKVDIVHCHGRSTFSLAAVSRTMRGIKSPLLLHDHYGKIEMDSSVPLWFRIWGKHYLAAYVGVSENLGRWAHSAGVREQKINVIDNALNLSRIQKSNSFNLRQKFWIPDESLVGIVVAGLRYEKGIGFLIEALSKSKNLSRIQIVIVGGERENGYLESCKNLAERMGVAKHLIFAGEQNDTPSWVRSADFALIPSRSESGPLVLIEYLAAGLPIVATLTGSIARTAADNLVPGFVKLGEQEDFTIELDKLVELKPQARRDRGLIGKSVAEKMFDIRQTMPQWYRVYQGALGQYQS
jgi:glycosyltransferase involved in cell wall biosynthesis